MIIQYLTWLKKSIGVSQENIILPESVRTISELLDYLEETGLNYKRAFSNRNVIYAEINGHIVDHETHITDEQEINFFSPIVGG